MYDFTTEGTLLVVSLCTYLYMYLFLSADKQTNAFITAIAIQTCG